MPCGHKAFCFGLKLAELQIFNLLEKRMVIEKKSPPEKLEYKPPVVLEYGSIRALTQNVGPKGALDNGGGGAAGPKTR